MNLKSWVNSPVALLFTIGFASSATVFWHDRRTPILWRLGIPVLVGLIMIPTGLLISIPLVGTLKKLGIMSEHGTTDSGAE